MNLPSPTIALIGIGAVLFVIVLVVVHLITSHISDSIQDSRVGMIDRVLGFMFGAIRGFVLVVIPYMFYAHFVPEEQHYAWVSRSQSLPYIKSTGETFRTLLERYTPAPVTTPTGDQQQG
jgi:membrane protein required for colicin V production